MGKPTKELRAKLDELGVEYDTYDLPNGEHGVSWIDGNGIEWEAVQRGENFEIHALQLVTPEQAIDATVGRRTDLSKRLRKITGLHAFAELFGFDWTDDSDWTWHDVACAMADAVDAATVGDAREPSNAVIERIERFCTDYAQCLMDSTILVKRNYESMDLRAVKKAEVVEDRLIRELAEYIATVGKDIERYDGSGRRGTVAILQGGRKPEEVLFVRDEGGVTHYLPEGTCHLVECEHEREVPHDLPDCDGGWYTEVTHDCDECGYENTDPNIRFCGGCGRKVVAE